MARRGSSLFPQGTGGQPMAGGIGFDYDSESDEEEQQPKQPAPAPAPPLAPGAGSANHRPMVGGFAAAAYEAARAHHYAMKQKQQKAAQAKARTAASRPRN